MINLAHIVNSKLLGALPDIAVERTAGKWKEGRFVLDEPHTFSITANVQPASPFELEQFPEGSRVKGTMVFRTTSRLYITQEDEGSGMVSDMLIWKGRRYKVMQVNDYGHYGYYEAFAFWEGA